MGKFLLMMVLLFVTSGVHAQQQGGCPGGLVPAPTGACVSQAEANQMQAASAAAATPRYTGPLWQDRFGALANSATTSAGGVAQNMSSERAAKEKALSDCGARDCKIKIAVRNACLATAEGGGFAVYKWAGDFESAKALAINDCKKEGGDCEVKYSACSLPVRIR